MVEALIAFSGVVLGAGLTAAWDRFKERRRFHDLVALVAFELEANLARANEVFEDLPEPLKSKFREGGAVELTESEIRSVSWSFPKPYVTDAWRTFVSSGLTARLDSQVASNLFKIHDQIHALDFLGGLSVRLFHIMAQDNRLSPDTNANFDRFCRIGTVGQQVAIRRLAKDTVGQLKALLPSEGAEALRNLDPGDHAQRYD